MADVHMNGDASHALNGLPLPQLDRPLYQENEYHHLVDALPYVDPVANELQMEVKRLIEDEMKRMPKRDYLERLPAPPTSFLDTDPLVKEEMERVKGRQTPKQIDRLIGTLLNFLLILGRKVPPSNESIDRLF
jgi:hypothetical protein